jgi:sigma-B regulation protein RsbU (phosphoserine phosphatase)
LSLAYLNGRFRPAPGIVQYFTMVYGVLDVENRQLTYTAAGHPGPIQLPVEGEPTVHPSTGVPIGMFSGVELEQRKIDLSPGDRLYFYTDGVTEALDDQGEEFGKDRLLEALATAREVSIAESLKELVSNVRKWQGDEIGEDDLSLLAAELG